MKIRTVDYRTRLRGFHFHQRCLCKYATPDKQLLLCSGLCVRTRMQVFVQSLRESSPVLSAWTQQHPGDYLSLWKVTTSMSLGQSSHKYAEDTHTVHTNRLIFRSSKCLSLWLLTAFLFSMALVFWFDCVPQLDL